MKPRKAYKNPYRRIQFKNAMKIRDLPQLVLIINIHGYALL